MIKISETVEKTCDLCGQQYETSYCSTRWPDVNPFRKTYSPITDNRRNQFILHIIPIHEGKERVIDLCPKCEQELLNWLNAKSNEREAKENG